MYLTLENITKIFPPRGGAVEVTAVQNVNLEIKKGELVTLLRTKWLWKNYHIKDDCRF